MPRVWDNENVLKTTLMEELMPVLNSPNPVGFYRSYQYSHAASKAKSPNAEPQYSYTLQVVEPEESYEPGLDYGVNFLNYLFVAKLRTWVVKKRRGRVLKDIDSNNTQQFVAKVNRTQITVQPNCIKFDSTDETDLEQSLREVAMAIFTNYSNISLRITCANKSLQRKLEKILTEVYLYVENRKLKQRYDFFTSVYEDLSLAEQAKPSAPPLPIPSTF